MATLQPENVLIEIDKEKFVMENFEATVKKYP